MPKSYTVHAALDDDTVVTIKAQSVCNKIEIGEDNRGATMAYKWRGSATDDWVSIPAGLKKTFERDRPFDKNEALGQITGATVTITAKFVQEEY